MDIISKEELDYIKRFNGWVKINRDVEPISSGYGHRINEYCSGSPTLEIGIGNVSLEDRGDISRAGKYVVAIRELNDVLTDINILSEDISLKIKRDRVYTLKKEYEKDKEQLRILENEFINKIKSNNLEVIEFDTGIDHKIRDVKLKIKE